MVRSRGFQEKQSTEAYRIYLPTAVFSTPRFNLFDRQRLSLDIDIRTKYVYVRKHKHTTRIKKPQKSCFSNVMKISVCECSVKYGKIKISGCATVQP